MKEVKSNVYKITIRDNIQKHLSKRERLLTRLKIDVQHKQSSEVILHTLVEIIENDEKIFKDILERLENDSSHTQ